MHWHRNKWSLYGASHGTPHFLIFIHFQNLMTLRALALQGISDKIWKGQYVGFNQMSSFSQYLAPVRKGLRTDCWDFHKNNGFSSDTRLLLPIGKSNNSGRWCVGKAYQMASRFGLVEFLILLRRGGGSMCQNNVISRRTMKPLNNFWQGTRIFDIFGSLCSQWCGHSE